MKSKKKKMENKDSSLRSTETAETPEVAAVYWLQGVNVFELFFSII